MLQSQYKKIKEKFESNQHLWQEKYYRNDYESLTFQWRQDDCVSLCQKHLHANSRILDLGCGCGHASLTLAQLGYNVVGIDFCESMVKQAQRNAEIKNLQKNCTFKQADFAKDKLTLGSYDGIIALGFIEYFDDPITVLRNIHSLLSVQGIAVIQIWNRNTISDRVFSPLYANYQKLFNPIQIVKRMAKFILPKPVVEKFRKPVSLSADKYVYINVTHHRYTPSEFYIIAKKSGFKIIDVRVSHFLPYPFFFSDNRRIRWDKKLQTMAADNEFIKAQAYNYVAVLRKEL